MTPTRTPRTEAGRTEQIIRFVERMREPDVLAPDEEYRLRHLLSLHAEEVVSEYREALRELVESWRADWTPTGAIERATAAMDKARLLLQADQVAAAEPGQ